MSNLFFLNSNQKQIKSLNFVLISKIPITKLQHRAFHLQNRGHRLRKCLIKLNDIYSFEKLISLSRNDIRESNELKSFSCEYVLDSF